MKTSKILIASTLVLALACGKKSSEEHGHEHGPDSHEHVEEGQAHEATPQEEFTLEEDTTHTHTHENGETHDDH